MRFCVLSGSCQGVRRRMNKHLPPFGPRMLTRQTDLGTAP
uniref:Uncharacterized protein n=1 Tax=Anguilla anguilla TaxID=7936 RepID=A0A0E9S909_ANGAN